MLFENIVFLRKHFPYIREVLLKNEKQILLEPINIKESQSGVQTAIFSQGEREYYIHSKYNPLEEAKKIISNYSVELEKYKHVLFYGIGLGYHINEVIKEFPQLSFSIYEPNPSMMYHFLSYQKLNEWPVEKLKNFVMEVSPVQRLEFLKQFTENLEEVMIIPLPSYERVFKEHYQLFMKEFKDVLKNKRMGVHTDLAYEKRWVFNSLMNLEKVNSTTNIILDIKRSQFEQRPAMIIAAGPSLYDDLEHIRYIKENNLAYIFSVGSSINTLIEYNIYPDAAFTYDPNYTNKKVFEKLIEKEINSIPLIFGSSVGFETLQNYPGEMLHFITSQDTVAPKFLIHEESNDLEIIPDAPSIAVMTFQILCKMGFNPIILAGQNLAYKNEQRYSKGINYDFVSNEVSQSELEEAITIKDVYGNDIKTTEGFNSMRRQLEYHISQYPLVKVFNSTKGGAAIRGTQFLSIEEIIKNVLNLEPIRKVRFSNKGSRYSKNYIINKIKNTIFELEEIIELYNTTVSLLLEIEKHANEEHTESLEKLYIQVDQNVNNIQAKDAFIIFIYPMIRVELDILSKKIKEIRYLNNKVEKSKKVVEYFSRLLLEFKNIINLIVPNLRDVEKKFR